jgi:ABC-2 type transport system ATP-binding protein
VSPETTVLLASHRLEEVETVAERIWILHDGRIVFDGSLGDLRAQAKADAWLWVRTAPDRRDAARDQLARLAGSESVVANGTHVAVQSPAGERAEALWRLRESGVPIEDFWVVEPSLEEIVEGFFRGEAT